MKHTKSGYILMLTLMIISLLVVLMNYIMVKTSAYSPFARATIEREKATFLALSGVQVACAQLAKQPEKKQSQEGQQQQQQNQDVQTDTLTILKTVLPVKNRWQKFTLKKAQDGINGTIAICIVSEDGKININEWYDFKKHEFAGQGKAQGDAKKMMQLFFERIKSSTGGENLFPIFEKFLKERQYKLRDTTELLAIKEFEIFKKVVFYEPSEHTSDEKKEKRPIYLTDIFTVWSGHQTIDPWLFSESLCTLLGLQCIQTGETGNKELVEALKKFKKKASWSTDWNTIMAPIYGKKFDGLPKDIESFLRATSDPTTFSVLSYGKVGKITQKALAIIERQPAQDKTSQGAVIIKKLYWL